jgi:N utilization substance protein A
VHDQQLSLAIGKEGQNARLAARLTGWRIDIRSESEGEEQEVVEEVWTEGDVVVDEKVVIVEAPDHTKELVEDVVLTEAQGGSEEIVVVEDLDASPATEEEA